MDLETGGVLLIAKPKEESYSGQLIAALPAPELVDGFLQDFRSTKGVNPHRESPVEVYQIISKDRMKLLGVK